MTLTQVIINFGNGDTLPFTFRDQSVGDRGVIQQIFVNKDYDLARLPRFPDIQSEYERILSLGRIPLIVDCGANIGAASVWFAKSFPKSLIFALEPEMHNFEILRLNSRKFSNIVPERAAISCTDETLHLVDPGAGDWGFRMATAPTGESTVTPALSIATIQKRFEASDLFLVKIDIEGSEARLFGSHYEWINRTMIIVVELHDWMLPRSANSQNCLRALSRYSRDFVCWGENVFSIRND